MAFHPQEIKPTINQSVKGAVVKRATALYNIYLVDNTVYCLNNHPSEHFIALHTCFPQLANLVVSVAVKPSADAALKAAPVSEL